MVVKRKLEIPVFQEWRMKKLEPFVGIFTMVGILCLIQIMIGNRWNGAHIFFYFTVGTSDRRGIVKKTAEEMYLAFYRDRGRTDNVWALHEDFLSGDRRCTSNKKHQSYDDVF